MDPAVAIPSAANAMAVNRMACMIIFPSKRSVTRAEGARKPAGGTGVPRKVGPRVPKRLHDSVRFNARLADHLTPAWRIAADDCHELLWGSACHQHTELEHLLPSLGRLNYAVDLRSHALKDRAGCADRCQDAMPADEVDRIALLGEGWQVWK